MRHAWLPTSALAQSLPSDSERCEATFPLEGGGVHFYTFYTVLRDYITGNKSAKKERSEMSPIPRAATQYPAGGKSGDRKRVRTNTRCVAKCKPDRDHSYKMKQNAARTVTLTRAFSATADTVVQPELLKSMDHRHTKDLFLWTRCRSVLHGTKSIVFRK